MSGAAITVEGLSKLYLLGRRSEIRDTLAASLISWLGAPARNLRNLRRLNTYRKGAEDAGDDLLWALREVSFEVERGHSLGIIGRNGAGKTTLLKVLSRITEPTRGTVTLEGRVASLLEVGTGFHPELTGRENVYMNGTILGMRKREIDNKFDEIVAFSGVERFIDTPIKRYSSGMNVRLAFSVAAHLEPEILLIDEVLAVGDAEFQERCLGKMESVAKQGRTVLFVSHNLGAVRSLCDSCILLEHGSIATRGAPQDVIQTYLDARTGRDNDGTVLDAARTIHTGEARITHVRLVGDDGGDRTILCYRETIRVRLTVQVTTAIRAAFFDIKISAADGSNVAYGASILDGSAPFALAEGTRNIQVEAENLLLPGRYALTFGIHQPDGPTYDYVEHVVDFTVSHAASGDDPDYLIKVVHAPIRAPSQWSIEEHREQQSESSTATKEN